jgi:hypothetical protein
VQRFAFSFVQGKTTEYGQRLSATSSLFLIANDKALSMSHRLVWLFLTFGGVCCVTNATGAQPAVSPRPLAKAHAHNDYEHEHPLVDALDHGFCSVEADVYLVGGDLLVAHDRKDIKAERTLSRLYLEPLAARVKANGGGVYKQGPRFWLLIDIKSEAEPTYRALDSLLARYSAMLSSTKGDKYELRAVTVVVSGNRPIDYMTKQQVRFAGIDGRLSDLRSDLPAELMPMISDNWSTHFRWRGQGDFPAEERDRLHSYVQKAHDRGRIVRFWATAEEPALWRELDKADVDLINTDKLAELADFLMSSRSKATPAAAAPRPPERAGG